MTRPWVLTVSLAIVAAGVVVLAGALAISWLTPRTGISPADWWQRYMDYYNGVGQQLGQGGQ